MNPVPASRTAFYRFSRKDLKTSVTASAAGEELRLRLDGPGVEVNSKYQALCYDR